MAGFVDARIGFARREASTLPLRPFMKLGVRYQIEGRRADALSGYAGGLIGLQTLGTERTEVVGIAGARIGYYQTPGLDPFSTLSA